MLDIFYNFSDFYTRQKEHTKSESILSEMRQIEEDFYLASKSAQQLLESRKDDSATLSATEMLTIDIGRGLKIADESSETVLTLSLPNATVVEFTVHCQTRLQSKFKGTVDSCLFLTVIRNATLCSLFQTVKGT